MDFEKLSQCINGLPETYLIGCFIARLKEKICLDVKVKQPRSLSDTIGVARLIKEHNLLQWKMSYATCAIAIKATWPLIDPMVGILGPPLASKQTVTNITTLARWLISQEARERWLRGICFYCDEKFEPGHKCQQPQFFMINDPKHLEKGKHAASEKELHGPKILPEISFREMASTTHHKLYGLLEDFLTVILLS